MNITLYLNLKIITFDGKERNLLYREICLFTLHMTNALNHQIDLSPPFLIGGENLLLLLYHLGK